MYFAYVQEMLKMSPDAGGLEYGAVALVDALKQYWYTTLSLNNNNISAETVAKLRLARPLFLKI